jgi:hypothetical protein
MRLPEAIDDAAVLHQRDGDLGGPVAQIRVQARGLEDLLPSRFFKLKTTAAGHDPHSLACTPRAAVPWLVTKSWRCRTAHGAPFTRSNGLDPAIASTSNGN